MTLTPAQQQYHDLKQSVPDCILFFRLGDFYEVFHEDAKICSKVLDIVLTARNKNNPDPIPMAGIPYHSADKYIHKLIHHGYKVAIAEQTSQPTPGKIVSREISRIITPATYLSETSKSTATIVAICYSSTPHGAYHLARGNFAIGEYSTGSYHTIEDTLKQCFVLSPQELIIDIDLPERDHLHNHHHLAKALMTVYDRPHQSTEYVRNILRIQTLESYGSACAAGRIDALGLLFHYLSYTQKHALSLVSRISYISSDQHLIIDDTTLKNLEILTTSYDQSETHSLLHTLDHTQTAMGSRLLKDRILHPSTNINLINERLTAIGQYVDNHDHCVSINHDLKGLIDIPKLVSLIIQRKETPSLLSKLRNALGQIFESGLYNELPIHHCPNTSLEATKTLRNNLHTTLKPDPLNDESDYIADHIDDEIDRLRVIAYHSDDLLLEYQQYLIQTMHISNIKIKYIINQGYAIEITNKDISTFEQACVKGDEKLDLVRRQTLKGAERYMSPYLDHLQQDIISAKDQLTIAEKRVLNQLKTLIEEHIADLTAVSQALGRCDVTTSMALYARAHQYSKPHFDLSTKDSYLHVVAGRHPVIESILPHHTPFIPNDLLFDTPEQTLGYQRSPQSSGQDTKPISSCVHIITGPNMGGKSTYLRQNALIVLMAHCGLRVPAQEVRLSLFDGIFARIGSGDNQARQQSTFMTEMIEVSNILNNATKNSLIVFDELGRGTSTYDGLALTESIILYIANVLKAKTLVATHYHELIDLAHTYPQIANYSVGVYETDKEVVFLKKIVSGGANKSYGIDVAKLAGIPDTIIQQAKKRLTHFQYQSTTGLSTEQHPHKEMQEKTTLRGQSTTQTLPKEYYQYHKLKQLLDSIIVDQTTPLQALGMIAKLKEEL